MKAKVKATITFEYEADSDHYDHPEDFEEFEQKIHDYDSYGNILEVLQWRDPSNDEVKLKLDIKEMTD